MRFHIIIPAHNEEAFLGHCLRSLVSQTLKPERLIVVDDHSEDNTGVIAKEYSDRYPFIDVIQVKSSSEHLPGSKVVSAFSRGLEILDPSWDIICKFDADLIFPPDYLERIAGHYISDESIGMAGGFCYIPHGEEWELEALTGKDHIRGAIKSYRRRCFQQIGGLRNSMGWDTVDELLAQYHGWKVITDTDLKVKHLRPTGKTYGIAAKLTQGEAFYKMRYGFLLSLLASLKLAVKKGKLSLVIDYMNGYRKARSSRLPFLVDRREGAFIRKLRYSKMIEKIF